MSHAACKFPPKHAHFHPATFWIKNWHEVLVPRFAKGHKLMRCRHHQSLPAPSYLSASAGKAATHAIKPVLLFQSLSEVSMHHLI